MTISGHEVSVTIDDLKVPEGQALQTRSEVVVLETFSNSPAPQMVAAWQTCSLTLAMSEASKGLRMKESSGQGSVALRHLMSLRVAVTAPIRLATVSVNSVLYTIT